jgi:hypothetical protein
MKTKTILKTVGWFMGWIVSFQIIDVGIHLMNKPSNIAFTFGLLLSAATIVISSVCAFNLAKSIFQLIKEARTARIRRLLREIRSKQKQSK